MELIYSKINILKKIYCRDYYLVTQKFINVKINFSLITVITAMVCFTGCVSTKKFDSLQANYNKLQDTNSLLTREGEECKNNLDRATVKISGLQEQINSE